MCCPDYYRAESDRTELLSDGRKQWRRLGLLLLVCEGTIDELRSNLEVPWALDETLPSTQHRKERETERERESERERERSPLAKEPLEILKGATAELHPAH